MKTDISTTTSLSDEDEIITVDEEEIITFTKSEIEALLKECKWSYISYENPIAVQVIRRMMKFADPQ